MRITLNNGQPLLQCQWDLMRSTHVVRALFGGWGSGKTRAGALALLDNAIRNPWSERLYGGDRPFSLVISLTHKVLRDSSHRELMATIPRELIAYERKSPDWELGLVNGHVLRFRTARGAIEGSSAVGVWLDEAHLIQDPSVYLNYQMRARDPRANSRVVIVTGLPMSGWLQDVFGVEDPNRTVLHARTADNIYLPSHVVEEFRKSTSKKAALRYLEGQWMPPENAVFYEYVPSTHVVDDPGDRNQACHLSFDVGDCGSVLWLQERKLTAPGKQAVRTLHVVDELVTTNLSVADQMRAAKSRGWLVTAGVSLLFCDPTIRRDEIAAVRDVWGDAIGIIRQQRGSYVENVEYGVDCINAALRDVEGRVRLTFSSTLSRKEERSLLTAVGRYHRSPNGKPVRDNVVDHVCDALRYPVAHLLPTRSSWLRAEETKPA